MRRFPVPANTPRVETHRRWRWVHPRDLRCLEGEEGHRFKMQPYIPTHTGLCCTHREPPGDGPVCGRCALYAHFPECRAVLVVECSMRELAHILDAALTRDQALAYLGVTLPNRVAPNPIRAYIG